MWQRKQAAQQRLGQEGIAETGQIVEKVAGTEMVSGSTCEWEGETAFDGAQTFEKEG